MNILIATPKCETKNLNEKFNILKNKYLIAIKTLDNLKNIPSLSFDGLSEVIFIKKVDKFYYLETNSLKENNCFVCGLEKQTTAHHLIPARANCKNHIAKKLKIRICDDCNKKVHPEKIDGLEIINAKEKYIEFLKKKLDNLIHGDDIDFIKNINDRIEKLTKDVRKVHLLPDIDKRSIFPAQKQLEGRISELKHIKILFSNSIKNKARGLKCRIS